MNDFTIKFEKEFQNKYVVLEFNNDTLSLIAYNILKNIQSIFPFQLLIYGKHNIFRKYWKTHQKIKAKFISKRIFTKLRMVNKAIYVGIYNPIYKVIDSKKYYNDFNKADYNLMNKFTPTELQIARNFYTINWIKKDNVFFNSPAAESFNKFCFGKPVEEIDFEKLFNKEKIKNINIIKLTGDTSKDNELVNQVVNDNDLIFYFICNSIDKYEILNSEYQYFLKNKSNIPNYWNINTYSILDNIIKNYCDNNTLINFIGDFNNEEKSIWLEG